jgi:hypothetical protein
VTLELKLCGTKNTVFEKQTREVIENTGYGLKNKPKQTQKQSREVVENTYLWKKRTKKNKKTNFAMFLKINSVEKTNPKRTGDKIEAPVCPEG